MPGGLLLPPRSEIEAPEKKGSVVSYLILSLHVLSQRTCSRTPVVNCSLVTSLRGH